MYCDINDIRTDNIAQASKIFKGSATAIKQEGNMMKIPFGDHQAIKNKAAATFLAEKRAVKVQEWAEKKFDKIYSTGWTEIDKTMSDVIKVAIKFPKSLYESYKVKKGMQTMAEMEANLLGEVETPDIAEEVVESKVKEGVDFVFEQNPELASIGTLEQYSAYLDTVFPNSKIKDIVYHGTNENFEQFDFSKGKDAISKMGVMAGSLPAAQRASMTNTPEQIKQFQEWENKGLYPKGFTKLMLDKQGYIKPLLFNLINPFVSSNFDILVDKTKNDFKNNDGFIITPVSEVSQNYLDTGLEYLVFEPEQIHILGSKQDIEGFKEFVGKPTKKDTTVELESNLKELNKVDNQEGVENLRESMLRDFDKYYPQYSDLAQWEKETMIDMMMEGELITYC